MGGEASWRGHGADVDDEPNLCKVMAWGVIVSTSHARGGDRVCVQQVGSMVCVVCVFWFRSVWTPVRCRVLVVSEIRGCS